jgi:hypothetical protein
MTNSIPFRLKTALVVLALPLLLAGAGRCADLDTRKEEDRLSVLEKVAIAQRAADRKGVTLVQAGEVRAALLLVHDPDEAYQHLKKTLDAIRSDPDLSTRCREGLQTRLEWACWALVEAGRFVKEQQFELMSLRADFRSRFIVWHYELARVLGAPAGLGALYGQAVEPLIPH